MKTKDELEKVLEVLMAEVAKYSGANDRIPRHVRLALAKAQQLLHPPQVLDPELREKIVNDLVQWNADALSDNSWEEMCELLRDGCCGCVDYTDDELITEYVESTEGQDPSESPVLAELMATKAYADWRADSDQAKAEAAAERRLERP